MTMPDLADFLEEKRKKSSYRQLAEEIGISRGALEKIIKRKSGKLPKVETLQKIADTYGLPLPRVVEMAGAALGDEERYIRLARELQSSPWLVERFNDLVTMTEAEFEEAMDYLAYRRRQDRPDQNGDRSIP